MEFEDVGLGVHAPCAVVLGGEDLYAGRDEAALVIDRLSERRAVLEIDDEEIRVACAGFAAFLEESNHRILRQLGAFVPLQPTGRPSVRELGFERE